MKLTCAYSSIEFNVEHFPGSLSTRETIHPVFQFPQKKLLSYLGDWGRSNLTPTDSYLLFLALLNSSELIEWRTGAIRTERTDSLVASHIERLCKTVIKLNTVTDVSSIFPHYVIGQDTRSLDSVDVWIQNWNDSFADYKAGKLKDIQGRDEWKRLNIRESALTRLIASPHRPLSQYVSSLADWASIAGQFPTFTMKNPHTGLTLSCADYWKYLIVKCANSESLYSIRRADLVELLEHCEANISFGTSFASKLFEILRHALEKQRNFLGLGDLDISVSRFAILSSDSSAEAANMRALIDSAPEFEPKPEQYPNRIAFLKAKMRWEMAKKYRAAESSESSESADEEE
jgi:hypothetical protein